MSTTKTICYKSWSWLQFNQHNKTNSQDNKCETQKMQVRILTEVL
jgi:hypothetical protein